MATKKTNLDLWGSVEKTNPKHTQEVKFGRRFTAIDPYHQLKRATEVFGPAGAGFGWEVVRVDYTTTNEMGILVRLWHGSRENWIEQWGQAGLYIDKDDTKKDGDCFKKAVTDGITKCLSCLGFNADVFLGMFEDNKYVALMNEEFHNTKPAASKSSPPASTAKITDDEFLKGVAGAVKHAVKDKDLKKLVSIYNTNLPRSDKLEESNKPTWNALFVDAKLQIQGKSS